MAKIHDKLREVLKYAKISAVAEAAGVDPNSIRLMLREERTPDLKTVMALSAVMDFDAGWAVDDDLDLPPVRRHDYDELNLRKMAARREQIERLERATGRVA